MHDSNYNNAPCHCALHHSIFLASKLSHRIVRICFSVKQAAGELQGPEDRPAHQTRPCHSKQLPLFQLLVWVNSSRDEAAVSPEHFFPLPRPGGRILLKGLIHREISLFSLACYRNHKVFTTLNGSHWISKWFNALTWKGSDWETPF